MPSYSRQIVPQYIISPGFHPVTGVWDPVTASMNANVKNVSSINGNEAFLRILVTFAVDTPTPAYVFLEPFYKSGITDFSVQPVNDDSTVSAVASSLAAKEDFLPDFSNVAHLMWNTESLITGGTNRFLVHGPVTALKITGTGCCYVLGN